MYFVFNLFYASACFTSTRHKEFSTVAAKSVDTIDQTCKKCADESIMFSYKVCTSSLAAVPVSHAANLQGLALIAMDLALVNATNTLSIINKLLNNESFDPFALVCLKDCLQLYSSAITTLVNARFSVKITPPRISE